MGNNNLDKITIVSDNTLDQVNGVVTTYNNIKVMAEKDGYNVKFITPDLFSSFPCPGYPEVRISLVPKNIGALLEGHIHIATEGPLGLAARKHCEKYKLKYTTAFHTMFAEYLNIFYFAPKLPVWKYLLWFHKNSPTFAPPRAAHELTNRGLTNVISWGRGVKPLAPSRERRVGIYLDLLYVGRVSREKNLKELCSLGNYSDILVTIVGDGPHRPYLERKFPSVRFLGVLQGPKLANAYQDADVFVFPSKTDTFGIAMIEAMSLGTPVATYKENSLVVDSGVTGYAESNLVYAIDKALTLDRALVKANAAKWTWEDCWQTFAKIIS
jgi:glycosyltransferase involved in cell wall biosynthesis